MPQNSDVTKHTLSPGQSRVRNRGSWSRATCRGYGSAVCAGVDNASNKTRGWPQFLQINASTCCFSAHRALEFFTTHKGNVNYRQVGSILLFNCVPLLSECLPVCLLAFIIYSQYFIIYSQ